MAVRTVSILVPTLNGAEDIARLADALNGQRGDVDVERIAVDSSSDDETVEVLRDAEFRVESIDRSEFGHGRTRNLLASFATGDFLVFLSQDAVPIGDDFLGALLEPFEEPDIAGVTARVLPFEDDDPLTARTVLSAKEASPHSETRRVERGTRIDTLPPEVRAGLVRFNNIASCIRRSVHRTTPFPDVPFGEDFAWAARALAAGHAVHSSGDAAVRHAHRYGPRQAFARYREDAVFHREFFGRPVRPTLGSVAKGIGYELKRDLGFLARGDVRGHLGRDCGWSAGVLARAGALLRAPALRTAQVLGQYAGRRGEDERWAAARSRGAFGHDQARRESGRDAQVPC